MNRIDSTFENLNIKKQKAFIAYICVGDPHLDFTERIVLEFEKIGVDIIELGIPFSDPTADGPTIQRASERALKNEVTISSVFKVVKRIRSKSEIPLVIMSYFNPIFRYGIKRFMKDSSRYGLDGLITVDVPFEEKNELQQLGHEYGIMNISFIAPTTTNDRLQCILNEAEGFIYYISLTGVTGARNQLPRELIGRLQMLKTLTGKPICVGFGISKVSQIKKIKSFCDGIIIGSAIMEVIEKNMHKSYLMKKVISTTKTLVNALKKI